MRKPVRFSVGLFGGALTLALVAACAGTTSGQPTPGDGGDSPSNTGSQQSSSRPTTGSSPGKVITSLKNADPCSILTTSDLDSLGLTVQGEHTNSHRSRGCTWTQNGASLDLAIRTNQGLTGFAVEGATHVKKLQIGDHNAKQQITPGTEGCVIGIGITATSRVDVSAVMTETSKECPAAVKSAKVVEPHLPPAH